MKGVAVEVGGSMGAPWVPGPLMHTPGRLDEGPPVGWAKAGGRALVLKAVRSFHVSGCLEYQVDPVRTLIVHTAPTHWLGEVVKHGPRCARQVTQVAVLPLCPVRYGHGHGVRGSRGVPGGRADDCLLGGRAAGRPL